MLDVKQINVCRACGDSRLDAVLDLGNLAISGFPAPGDPPLARAPLTLIRCAACTLVQLAHTVDREHLYRTYWYRSATNETMVAALRDVVANATQRIDLRPGDRVLDIGCNDGTMLRLYPDWVEKWGFEPARNLHPANTAGGLHIFCDFFPPPYRVDARFKVITSIAQFYDEDDPNAYVARIAGLLAPDGIWVVQFQDIENMLAVEGFDNICHEHLCYYSAGSFAGLLARHGLVIDGCHGVAVNGGSLRAYVRRARSTDGDWAAGYRRGDVARFGGVFGGTLERFAAEARSGRHLTRGLLMSLKADGATIYGYAASTKANTLLQFFGIGPDLVTAFAERSPEKWGRTTATGIPIVSEDEMRAARPAYLLIGAWQFAEAFAERERDLLATGTRMIVPLPTLRVMSAEREAVSA